MNLEADQSRNTRWWISAAQSYGTRLLDMHVAASKSWKQVESTGAADVERARREIGLPIGPRLDLLELGCGAGRMTRALSSHYGSVLGLDVSPELIRLAQERCRAPGVRFQTLLSDSVLPGEKQRFDVVFSYEVFHYLQPALLSSYLRDAVRLLKPNGNLVIQLNTRRLAARTRFSRAARHVLNAVDVKTWRGWPTAPEFFHRVYDVNWIIEQLKSAGFESTCVVNPGSRCTWFMAKAITTGNESVARSR